MGFFFNEFVSQSYLPFMDRSTIDPYLQRAIYACGFAGLANRTSDTNGREVSRRHYVEAIRSTNTALRNPEQAKQDNTLIAVLLLGLYEVSVLPLTRPLR